MKTALVLEIKKQLDRAGIVINDFLGTLDKLYIDPYTHYDMYPYVDIGYSAYNLRMCERGNVIYNERTTKVKAAAYFLLLDIVAKAAMKSSDPKEYEAAHFAKMDEEYARWHSKGINDFNIRNIL